MRIEIIESKEFKLIASLAEEVQDLYANLFRMPSRNSSIKNLRTQ